MFHIHAVKLYFLKELNQTMTGTSISSAFNLKVRKKERERQGTRGREMRE